MFLKLLPAGLAYGILQVALRFKNDRELARHLKARDPHAISDLYDRYGRLTYSVICRIVHNAAAAEDLVQETFLRVWTRVQSFDQERGALGPWILTIARHRAIDHLRSIEGRMPAGGSEIDRLEHAALFTDFEISALSIDRARRIRAAFEKLNPNQRMVIELAYFEGLSQTEMAGRMKQPLGNVKSWVRSALKALRDELTQAAIA
ncbi:MAG TPA: sigma-70 family RNA polymerase sigma factor [Bryobacteraceae bacterium]|nr:sigma-70 family RNA polymerase sigma factor [Bryobacteraceae bacterium]